MGFPTGPGVYTFTAAGGDALYVGKAADLRARVRSYLKPGGDGRFQLPWLAAEAHDVEFVCDRLLRTLVGDTAAPFGGAEGVLSWAPSAPT